MPWWSAYIGRSFGPGSECWSLVCEVYRDRLGIALPAHGDVSAAYVAAVTGGTGIKGARQAMIEAFRAGQAAENWIRVDGAPVAYDVVLMGTGKRVLHVGVAVDHRRVLHIERNTGCVLVPLAHASVEGRIIGFRRHSQACRKS